MTERQEVWVAGGSGFGGAVEVLDDIEASAPEPEVALAP